MVAGRNPDDAVRTFKAELEAAFKCLACYSKIEFVPGRKAIGGECAWLLVGEGGSIGIELPGIGGRFHASQTLKIEECDPGKYGGRVPVVDQVLRLLTRRAKRQGTMGVPLASEFRD